MRQHNIFSLIPSRQFSFLASAFSTLTVVALFISFELFSTLMANAEMIAPMMSMSAISTNSFKANDRQVKLKPVGDFRKDLKCFVKRSKVKTDSSQRIGAIVDLCLLHDQLVNDPRFQANTQLQGFRAVAADRLKKCRREIELEIKRSERISEKIARTQKSKPREQATDDKRLIDSVDPMQEIDSLQLEQWLMQDMAAITHITGGPIRFWGYTGGNYSGPFCDYGPDLVRLIETTINPDFWRSNGGSGIIHYYQPLRILVVSASSQVHSDLSDLLWTFRANGR